ncbi:TetR/AcrR family transcriptional regulator [Brevibacillus panacihumi]|uniref:TetR/AcrR family transcriptional regulator n=1 Tax=Brevibacillus panacihumi TaxID=497735 RepID=A0A3M8DE00_9BACL|nr:TetR/AcrR family transcriptional regulator [Brevibacillus panacihumi]RNB86390.1 TetR/AcrR family transcriptional regulator [Brevibacillus panacihumi]
MSTSKKDQIAQGALTAFSQYGYSETTMDSIAEIAQVAKGTLYYHFATKEELFWYVVERGVKMLIYSVDSVISDETLSLEDRMKSILDGHLHFFSENRELCFLLLSIFTTDEQRNQFAGKLLTNYFTLMEGYMHDLKEQGFIRQDADIQTLASALFGMVGFTALRKQFRNEPVDIEASRKTLLLMLDGALLE